MSEPSCHLRYVPHKCLRSRDGHPVKICLGKVEIMAKIRLNMIKHTDLRLDMTIGPPFRVPLCLGIQPFRGVEHIHDYCDLLCLVLCEEELGK